MQRWSALQHSLLAHGRLWCVRCGDLSLQHGLPRASLPLQQMRYCMALCRAPLLHESSQVDSGGLCCKLCIWTCSDMYCARELALLRMMMKTVIPVRESHRPTLMQTNISSI